MKNLKEENMIQDRRQDVGLKLVYVILTAIITLLLSMFFNKTYNLADEACREVNKNTVRIAVIEAQYCEIIRRLQSVDDKLEKVLGDELIQRRSGHVESYRLGS